MLVGASNTVCDVCPPARFEPRADSFKKARACLECAPGVLCEGVALPTAGSARALQRQKPTDRPTLV